MALNTIRLSVSEAAKLFGIEQKTIRRAIKEGQLRYVVVRGRYRITFDSLLAWSQTRPKIKSKFVSRGIGQYVDKWKIRNRLFSPNPEVISRNG